VSIDQRRSTSRLFRIPALPTNGKGKKRIQGRSFEPFFMQVVPTGLRRLSSLIAHLVFPAILFESKQESFSMTGHQTVRNTQTVRTSFFLFVEWALLPLIFDRQILVVDEATSPERI